MSDWAQWFIYVPLSLLELFVWKLLKNILILRADHCPCFVGNDSPECSEYVVKVSENRAVHDATFN